MLEDLGFEVKTIDGEDYISVRQAAGHFANSSLQYAVRVAAIENMSEVDCAYAAGVMDAFVAAVNFFSLDATIRATVDYITD